MGLLTGKIAIVTGGTGGLGKSVVRGLLKNDAVVLIIHRKSPDSIRFVEETHKLYPQFNDFSADITAGDSVRDLFDKIQSSYSKVDILCNLAGGVSQKKFLEQISDNEWEEMMYLNLHSSFFMIRGALSIMKKNRWGRIINISAKAGVIPETKRGGYSVSKAGIIALTKIVAEEVKEFDNITINAIAPSIIDTESNRKWGTENDFGKWVSPQHITDMIIYLCSEMGKSINGQVIKMFGKV